ncbi:MULTISPECIES: DNA-directed RNA polymerase subunit delta [Bacillus]|uniref:Probable DNA-directed RNA polymerase subunit delta n=2 Tax=Bacillus cereus group TaxID=86661 RepID=A0A2A7DFV3_BACAN|nr:MULTISPECIES: DNA-directed RNA polymerase subunit delta [Bacillus]MCP1166418.1 DNA-directed RNA polymerase subunit delta [Bacillus sp. 1813sda1]MDC7974422.1 DNA-directed RNA polymerase subunit delta [Bacillus sp. BLCC-B18]OTW69546.1 DNA-directed RNA polymerase subunit delta [Bacillus thuringiensis serovar coreanensis]OTX45744.1 DNA-directed RNA polymerase subunit delta [Bacillus thuringiensis serovar sooncheon]OTX48643.1 DNA-directed RNA polymerase subunit delta [Bacillus thuringiensis sero
MNFKQYSPEELKECSMIEVVHSVLGDKRQATTFNELVQEIAQVLGLSQEQVNAKLAQFYTDLNIDGRFINLGENRWGLRSWYPYEQIDEEILPQPKPKKKRKVEEDGFDDYIEEDEDFEDADGNEDEDDDVEDLDKVLEEEDGDDDDLDDLDEDDDDDFAEEELEYDETEEEEEEL